MAGYQRTDPMDSIIGLMGMMNEQRAGKADRAHREQVHRDNLAEAEKNRGLEQQKINAMGSQTQAQIDATKAQREYNAIAQRTADASIAKINAETKQLNIDMDDDTKAKEVAVRQKTANTIFSLASLSDGVNPDGSIKPETYQSHEVRSALHTAMENSPLIRARVLQGSEIHKDTPIKVVDTGDGMAIFAVNKKGEPVPITKGRGKFADGDETMVIPYEMIGQELVSNSEIAGQYRAYNSSVGGRPALADFTHGVAPTDTGKMKAAEQEYKEALNDYNAGFYSTIHKGFDAGRQAQFNATRGLSPDSTAETIAAQTNADANAEQNELQRKANEIAEKANRPSMHKIKSALTETMTDQNGISETMHYLTATGVAKESVSGVESDGWMRWITGGNKSPGAFGVENWEQLNASIEDPGDPAQMAHALDAARANILADEETNVALLKGIGLLSEKDGSNGHKELRNVTAADRRATTAITAMVYKDLRPGENVTPERIKHAVKAYKKGQTAMTYRGPGSRELEEVDYNSNPFSSAKY